MLSILLLKSANTTERVMRGKERMWIFSQLLWVNVAWEEEANCPVQFLKSEIESQEAQDSLELASKT